MNAASRFIFRRRGGRGWHWTDVVTWVWLIGGLLDKAFHTTWINIPFLILGSVAGFVQLIRQLMRDTGDDGNS